MSHTPIGLRAGWRHTQRRAAFILTALLIAGCPTPPTQPDQVASSPANATGAEPTEPPPRPSADKGALKSIALDSAGEPQKGDGEGEIAKRPLVYPQPTHWGATLLRGVESKRTDSGDLWGLWACDGSHMFDGRPGFERVGCMINVPGADLRRALFQHLGGLKSDTLTSFLMGAQSEDPHAPGYDADAGEDEAPPHEVTLSPYWLQRMEVTIRQYRWCLISGPCRIEDVGVGGAFNFDGDLDPSQLGPPKPGDERPINGISWEGARRYCSWIGGRLPTEAEWEYAARSGRLQHRYPWGNAAPTCRHAIFKGSETQPCNVTSATSEFTAEGHNTPSHILHQAGNLWEWTADWYAPDYYARSAKVDPKGPKTGTGRVQRGGSYSDDDPAVLRGAFRAQMAPAMKMPDVGFRCAADRVAHHPVTPVMAFTGPNLSAWSSGKANDTVTWSHQHGLVTVESNDKATESLRWVRTSFEGDGQKVLTMRVYPQIKHHGSVALLYGIQDARNHYRAEIYPADGVARLIRVLDGVEGVIAEASGLMVPNRGWLSLHIRWGEGRHRLSHSALNLVQGEDSTWRSGAVGMRLKGQGKATFEAAFSTP